MHFFSLGAGHDGTENHCPDYHGYIMSTGPGPEDHMDYSNLFKFSNCSIYEIKQHMEILKL